MLIYFSGTGTCHTNGYSCMETQASQVRCGLCQFSTSRGTSRSSTSCQVRTFCLQHHTFGSSLSSTYLYIWIYEFDLTLYMLLGFSGNENLPPSGEADRLFKTLKKCKVRYFRNRGDKLLMVQTTVLIIFLIDRLRSLLCFHFIGRFEVLMLSSLNI